MFGPDRLVIIITVHKHTDGGVRQYIHIASVFTHQPRKSSGNVRVLHCRGFRHVVVGRLVDLSAVIIVAIRIHGTDSDHVLTRVEEILVVSSASRKQGLRLRGRAHHPGKHRYGNRQGCQQGANVFGYRVCTHDVPFLSSNADVFVALSSRCFVQWPSPVSNETAILGDCGSGFSKVVVGERPARRVVDN